jgi:hypothetical protein
MVYAHSRQIIFKDYSQTNCGKDLENLQHIPSFAFIDQEWEWKFWRGVPSLSIEEIKCSSENKLSVIVVLQPAEIPGGPWQDIWEAEGKVFFNGEKVGVFDIRNPSYPEDGIDSYSFGRYTYLLPWEITTSVMVRITIQTTATVEVNNLWEYLSRVITRQELVEPLSNTSAIPSNTSANGVGYLPPLLGFIGLSIVLWIVYKKYGTRFYRRH